MKIENNNLNALKKFPLSVMELKDIRCITVCAMLLALRVVLGYLSNLGLGVIPVIKFGFNFLPVALVASLYGPVCAAIVGGLGDVISYLLMPMGGYFFGWTLNAVLVGVVYGLFLYMNNAEGKKLLLSLILCEVLIAILIEIPLGSLWLYIQFDKGFWVTAGARGLKCLASIPIETALIMFFSKILSKVPQLTKKHHT